MLEFRFCAPPLSLNGLGNQFFCWTKAYVASRELGLRLLHPAWSRNPRGYQHLFRTIPFDWEIYRVLSMTLPVFEFTQADYHAAGGGDSETALRTYATQRGLFSYGRSIAPTPSSLVVSLCEFKHWKRHA